jgi:Strictosidine synthase-like, N-terminal
LAARIGAVGLPLGRVNRSMATTSMPALRRLPVGGQGPEDVAVLHNRLVTGVADGRLLSVALDGTDVTMVADTGGRPLGIEILPDGRLVVCDAQRGLLRVVSPLGMGLPQPQPAWCTGEAGVGQCGHHGR